MALAEKLKVSIADYLHGELITDQKHEYINGEIFAMAGANRAHNIICINLSSLLFSHLRGTPCRVFNSDMKVRVETAEDDCFFYPDLHISCAESDTDPYFNCQPKLIIEVLSDTTERYDRAEKFHHYRKLPSLEEYILVAQDSRRVECYRRSEQWDLRLFQQDQQIVFPVIGVELTMSEIYEGINLDHFPTL